MSSENFFVFSVIYIAVSLVAGAYLYTEGYSDGLKKGLKIEAEIEAEVQTYTKDLKDLNEQILRTQEQINRDLSAKGW